MTEFDKALYWERRNQGKRGQEKYNPIRGQVEATTRNKLVSKKALLKNTKRARKAQNG